LIAAIGGHSPAGGCVLAICCDHRIMVEGDYRIGLNEVAVGIVPPATLFELYAFWIGPRKAYDLVVNGDMVSPERACELSLVDEICHGEGLIPAAEDRLDTFFQVDPIVWRKTKRVLRRDLVKRFEDSFDTAYEETMAHWWTDQSRSQMADFVAKLKKK